MLTVTFTMLGDVQVARAFSRYGDTVKDFKPAWRRIREDFARIESEHFDSRGARSGAPWAPLSPGYAAWKATHFPGQPILRATGWMWSQLAVGTGLRVVLEPMRLVMAPTMPYAGIHQQGSPMTGLPMRKPVSLTEADKNSWMKILHNYIYDKAKEAHLA